MRATEPDAFDGPDLAVARLWAATVTMVFVRIERERQLKAQRQAAARERDRLEEFASVVSHDLWNPLNVAAGNLEMVRTRLVDAETESTELDVIDRSLHRMESIITDMLTLARQGDAINETGHVSLSTLAETRCDGVDTPSASLSVRGGVRVKADRSRLRQAVENLVRNAVDHGGDGVRVAVSLLDDAGFYVEDDGPGIPAERREEVFEAGVSTDPGGTGLGLKIVSEVAEAHG